MHCGFSSHLGSSTSLHRGSLWSLRAVQVMARGGQRHATAPHRLLPTGVWGKSFPPPRPVGLQSSAGAQNAGGPRPGSHWASGWHSFSSRCRLRRQGEHGIRGCRTSYLQN